MQIVFTVLYVNIDAPENSEVISCHYNKNTAIEALIKSAHYSVNKEGKLCQYLRETDEYESFEYLRKKVEEDLFLIDEDIYRIMETVLLP